MHHALPTTDRWWLRLLLGLALVVVGCSDDGQNAVFEGNGRTPSGDAESGDELARQAGQPIGEPRLSGEPSPAPEIDPILHVLGSIRTVETSASEWQAQVPMIETDLATIASLGCDLLAPECSTPSLVQWATDRVEVLNVATTDAVGENLDAVRSLFAAAEQAGIRVIGYGASQAEAVAGTVVETDAATVAIHAIAMSDLGELAATPDGSGIAGAASFDALAQSVEANLRQDLAVIVILDWDDRDARAPSTEQLADVQQLVDLGVDAVVGHGADFLQRFDRVAGTTVAYSLGNTTTTAEDPLRGDAAVLRLEFATPGRACLLAVTAAAGGPALDDPETTTCAS